MDLLKKGTIFAFALSAVSTAVWANGAAGVTGQDASAQARIGGEVSFQEADLDDSGFVDATEAKELELDIVEHDVNHDGLIDRTEWERAPEQASEAGAAGQAGAEMGESGAMQSAADMTDLTFEEADLDDSGFVDATEAKELDLDVVRFDMNYNGIIDPVEWARAPAEATDPGAASAQQSAADSEAQESGRVMRAPAEMVGLSFEEADLDDSGFVGDAEAAELGLDVSRFDVNYNGIIDRVEWERAPAEATEAGAASAQQSGADTQESGRVMRAPAEMVGLSFKEADLDDSGFVDAVEAGELGLDVVRFDVNYNGIIDRVEWERAPGEAKDPGKNRESQ